VQALEELAGGSPIKVAAGKSRIFLCKRFHFSFSGHFGVTPARYFTQA
jgi:hypothetical protein